MLYRLGLPIELLLTGKLRPTPVSGKYKKLETIKDNKERGDKTKYYQDIRSIMYTIVYSCLDIAFYIGQLS